MLLSEPTENYKSGYIKLFRSFKNHWIWEKGRKRTKTEAFLDLLLMASHSGSKEPIGFDLIHINKGQILTSQDKLCKSWLWDRGAVRSFLKMLEKDGILSQQATSKYTVITICNYASYQDLQPSKKQNQANRTPTTQQQDNTYNNVKVIKEGKIKELLAQSADFLDKYGKSMIDNFMNYWTESDGKGKMRFEGEKYFEVGKRLATWYRNENKKVKNSITSSDTKKVVI